MKMQIRQGVFETNSSSIHAICISKDHDVDKLDFPLSIEFVRDEFGRWNDKLSDTHEKASYLYEAILGIYKNNADEKLRHIENVLSKCGITCSFEDSSYGYIDHVISGDLKCWIEEMMNDDEMLLTYLFGDAFIITGNDEDGIIDEILHNGVTKVDTDWRSYTEYDFDHYKSEFDSYDIYEKVN